MTLEIGSHYSLLDELDSRQDELLEQIDRLNHRLELLLAQFTAVPSHLVPPPVIAETE
jgi:hypothetical protein